MAHPPFQSPLGLLNNFKVTAHLKDLMSKKMIEQVAIIFCLCKFQSPLVFVQ